MGRTLGSKEKLHVMPKDMKEALSRAPVARAKWVTLTPLAQNEWVCWVTSVKKKETRKEHLLRCLAEVSLGKRRPCCWPGCPHRRPALLKWFGKRVREK